MCILARTPTLQDKVERFVDMTVSRYRRMPLLIESANVK